MQQSLVRTVIWAVAIVCAALILANGGVVAQREMLPPEEPSPSPTPVPEPDADDLVPVAVSNVPTVDVRGFPHVVTVEGTVDVGNVPATQNVAGSVDVGNLPLDTDGNLRVSIATEAGSGEIRFAGYTVPSTSYFSTALELNRVCDTTFAHTRACSLLELNTMLPPPPVYGDSFLVVEVRSISGTIRVENTCTNDGGTNGACTVTGDPPFAVACCGY